MKIQKRFNIDEKNLAFLVEASKALECHTPSNALNTVLTWVREKVRQRVLDYDMLTDYLMNFNGEK